MPFYPDAEPELDSEIEGSRYFPMNWVPRWCEANFNTSSVLRKIYFLSLYNPIDTTKQLLKDNIVPVFYGDLKADRYLFTAKYHYPKTYIPHIVLWTSGSASSAVVLKANTKGDLLYETINPIYFFDGSNLLFKNLDIKSVAVTATSGFLNLASTLSSFPIDSDSPFIVSNAWFDQHIVDQTSELYFSASGRIYVNYNGSYTVYYRSTLLNTLLQNQTSFIRIDNETIPIKLIYDKNIWDTAAENFSLKRNKWETNLQLKARIQHISIAKRPNQRIAASLGQTMGLTWYTSGAAVSVSAYNDFEIQDYSRSIYVEEIATRDNTNYVLSYSPTGHVQVFLNGLKVHESAYVVSGSFIIPQSPLLQNTTSPLYVTYKHKNIADRSLTTTSLVTTEPDGLLYRGILVDDVIVANTTKKPKQADWKWNRELGLLKGDADFDF